MTSEKGLCMSSERVIEARGETSCTIRSDTGGTERRGAEDVSHENESRITSATEPPASHVAEALSRLAGSGYVALRQLRCESRDGVLFLYGRVPSYHLKQLAQTLVREIEGVAAIVNSVQVVHPNGQVS